MKRRRAPESVVLHGGPMDGWVVRPDAPVLRSGWAPLPAKRGLLDRLLRRADRTPRGRYLLDADAVPRTATWQEED